MAGSVAVGLAADLDGWLRLRDWLDRRGPRARALHAARARRRPHRPPLHPADRPGPHRRRRARRRPLAPAAGPDAAARRGTGRDGDFGALVFRAMIANRFFSAVVRIQETAATGSSTRAVRHGPSPRIPGDDPLGAVQRTGARIVARGRTGAALFGADPAAGDVRGRVPARELDGYADYARACPTGWCPGSGEARTNRRPFNVQPPSSTVWTAAG